MKKPMGALVLGLTLGTLALQTQTVSSGELVPDGEKELNEKYHVPLTKEALLRALNDQAPAVRGAAASKLVAQGDKDAIPFILAALARERVVTIRMSLAYDAASLGAEEGTATLKGMCANKESPLVIRMTAAQTSSYLNNEDCLPDVLDALRSHDEQDDPAVWVALGVLRRYQRVPAEAAQQIRSLVPPLLKSGDAVRRVDASDVLGKYGDAGSIEQLKAALASEQDDGARKAMTSAITSLESAQAKPTGQ